MNESPDEQQLAYAAKHGQVRFTYHTRDYLRLHTEWLNSGREHAGIIVAPQQRFSVGEQLRRIIRIRTEVSADDMRNRLEFLTSWD